MVSINTNYLKLPDSYLFSEINKRVQAFSRKNPGIKILRLGIGNTTEPLIPIVVKNLIRKVKKLSRRETYTGYGDEQGDSRLRLALTKWYLEKGVKFVAAEIFISDGAKSDTANIASIFSPKSIIAITDPVYPVYLDANIISGRKIVYLQAQEQNGFIAKPPKQKVDLIFLCSPNNPTGAVMTKQQLKEFISYAIQNKTIIIFDAAYVEYIQDPKLPRSIYEIPGAKSCAIEINSFSKWAGFTGLRLGWSVVPMDLAAAGADKGKINSLWNRRQTTMFNGASNVAQEGGLAVLSKLGQKQAKKQIKYYMDNAKIIKNGLSKIRLMIYGGENAPYIWVACPKGISSWEFFDKLLTEAHVVSTPGIGFGRMGEGYLRLSAFGHKEGIKRAVKSIQQNLKI